MASESITCCHFQKKAWGKCGRKPLQLVDFLFFSLLNHLHVRSSVPSVRPSVHPSVWNADRGLYPADVFGRGE